MNVWIESHQALGRHPKLLRLAGKLRVHKATAIGHLQYLWWWALDYAPTGNLSAFTPAEISAGAEWPGEPGPFHEALCECGWIDHDGQIHDWDDYGGKYFLIREKDRDRKRAERASERRPKDVQRTSNGRPDLDKRRGEEKTKKESASADSSGATARAAPPDSAETEILLTFPTDGAVKSWNLTKPKFDEYVGTYDTLNVMAEMKHALQWLRDHPDRRKTARGMPSYLTRWLNRAVDSGHGSRINGNGFLSKEEKQRQAYQRVISESPK